MRKKITMRQYLFGVEIEADVEYSVIGSGEDELSNFTVTEVRMYGNAFECPLLKIEILESGDLSHHVIEAIIKERKRGMR